jgi:hypothetical protein
MCVTDLDLELEIVEIAEDEETPGLGQPSLGQQGPGPQPAGGQAPGVAWGRAGQHAATK